MNQIELLQEQINNYTDLEDAVGLDMLKTRLIEAMRLRIFELEGMLEERKAA